MRIRLRRDAAKRAMDVILGAAGVAVLAPALLAIAAVVRIDSRGPALYRSRRVGRHGREFDMLKFRTMVAGAVERGGLSTPKDDPRITRVGAWLRRFKLDELPQLLNVLRGEMSLVGPRPQARRLVDVYSAEDRRVLDLRPGITDYASLRFRNEAEILRGAPDADQAYLALIHPEKIRLAVEYARRHSLSTDLRVLVATMGVLMGVDPAWALPDPPRAGQRSSLQGAATGRAP